MTSSVHRVPDSLYAVSNFFLMENVLIQCGEDCGFLGKSSVVVREGIVPLYSALVRLTWSATSSGGVFSTGKM